MGGTITTRLCPISSSPLLLFLSSDHLKAPPPHLRQNGILMATASGYSTLVSNNYASSSKTDLSSLSSNDGLSDASITHYGTFQQLASSNGRSRASRHENFPSSSSASTLVNEHDVLLRGRSRQRYTSGISLKGPLRLEKVDEHPPRLLEHINPQLLLENAGCVARDHLASERTFLSYVRTSLAISMTGIGESAQLTNQT